jgi:hypothetical protein
MWHLIIPPVVIVVIASVLAWYLSRKIATPQISASLDEAEGMAMTTAKARALSRREFVLKFSERIASSFKVFSLRVHNFFQSSTEAIRRQRKRIQEMKRVTDNVASSAKARAASLPKPSFSRLWRSPSETVGAGAVPEAAPREETGVRVEPEEKWIGKKSFTFFRRRLVSEKPESSSPRDPAPVTKPEVVLETPAALPEEPEKMKREEKWKEEGYIRRISENPKDIEAYEELGDYYLSIGNLSDAKACYRQVLKLMPTNRFVRIKIRRLEKMFEG